MEVEMKKLYFALLALILLICSEAAAANIEPVRVRHVEGEILYRTPDSGGWLAATVNVPLDEGDSVWCPDGSRAELQLPDGTLVRVNGGSQLNLLAIEEDFFHLNLASGRLYVRTPPGSRSDFLQIDADDTTVLPAGRTRLRLDMLANGQEDVSIFKGSAYVEGNGSRTRVRAGEHIALDDGRSELLPLNPPDMWESWNMDRDALYLAPQKAEAYLPEELRNYSGELDANGRWVSVPEYGMVWRPTVVLVDQWSPYSNGRWIWRGNEYVWIAEESWGWVPYHYGRWAVIASLGWCWVPPLRGDVYWGPGYVGWYTSGSYVGWTPLAPGEIFYGYGYYGRHSVNITTVNVNINVINYRNRHHRGGLTVLHQNDFVKERRVTAQTNIRSTVTVSVGSPRIRPVREIRATEVRPTHPRHGAARPEHRDSRELRSRFPRIITSESPQRGQITAPPKQSTGHSPERRVPQRLNPPATVHQQTVPPAGGKARIEYGGNRGDKQKRVWKVKPSGVVKESDPKGLEGKQKERKEK